MARRKFKKLRTRRINRLMEYGYSYKEAVALTGMKSVYAGGEKRRQSIILSRPYTRLMMRDRLRRYRNLQAMGISPEEYRRMVYDRYRDMGWIDEEGNPDYWKEFRFWRREAINLGLYIPPKGGHHKKTLLEGGIDREYVRRQAKKYRDREKQAKKEGYITTHYDSEGKFIGGVVYDEKTGKFTSKFEE